MITRSFSVLIFLVLVPASAIAASTTTDVPVGKGQRLVFTHPSTWQPKVSGPAVGPTLEFRPTGSGDFSVLITAIPRLNGFPRSDKELEGDVRQHGQSLLSTSLQNEVKIIRIAGKEASGYLYHLTDKNPERGPGDYREVNQGSVVVGPYLLSVTILTHSDDSATVAEALNVLSSATYQP